MCKCSASIIYGKGESEWCIYPRENDSNDFCRKQENNPYRKKSSLNTHEYINTEIKTPNAKPISTQTYCRMCDGNFLNTKNGSDVGGGGGNEDDEDANTDMK